MTRWTLCGLGAVAVLATVPAPAPSCSLCPNALQAPTFRQEAANASAKLILFGTLANPKLKPDGSGGTTEFHVRDVLRDDPFLAGRKMFQLPRFLPVSDPNNPPKFLVFCDVFK